MPDLYANLIISILCLLINWKNKINVCCILIVLAAQFGYTFLITNENAIWYYGSGAMFDMVCIIALCTLRTRMSFNLQIICVTDAFLCLLGLLTYFKGMTPDYKIAMTLMLYIAQTIVMLLREDSDAGHFRNNTKYIGNRLATWCYSLLYSYHRKKQKGG